MIDQLFSIGGFAITPFGVMLPLAFIAAFLQLRSGLRRLGVGDDEEASSMVVFAGFGGIIGGKVYYALLYRDWSALFDRAGLVWYGGLIGGVIAVAFVIHRRRMPFWRTADAAAPALALGYAVGRVGCFLVGDDYGRPTDLPWGVVFKKGLPPTTAGYLEDYFGIDMAGADPNAWVAVHPTQVYETLAALVIFAIGVAWLKRRPAPGVTFLGVMVLLAVERFAVEILRAKDDRFFGVFTLAQLISLAIVVLAGLLLAWRRGRRTEPGAAASRSAAPDR